MTKNDFVKYRETELRLATQDQVEVEGPEVLYTFEIGRLGHVIFSQVSLCLNCYSQLYNYCIAPVV
jgi:hypothetical protein